jgi:tetratricopeptide (TPR) repeat protein
MSREAMPSQLLSALIVTAGCLVGCGKPAAEPVNYHRDVAPIVLTHCASCHRPDGAAPFSLLTYADAKSRDSQIVELTHHRQMPPWLPEPGPIKFVGERRLADADIATLQQWVADGSLEGDPADSPPLPQFTAGWELGKPDLVLDSPKFDLSAAGKDRFRNFVLNVPLKDSRWVRAVELRPLNPRVTHHVRLGIDVSGESVRRDAADPDPEEGYEGMAWGADPPGELVTWTPGMRADGGTEDAAWELTPDVPLVLHTHLQPSGKSEQVGFQIGFHFTDKRPIVRPVILRVGNRDFDIPAGESRFIVRDSYVLPIDVDVTYIFPHAHSLCREMKITVETGDRESHLLLHIKQFDENWHDKYRLAYRPVRIPSGMRIVTEFVYDNSASNIRNPNNPPQRVVYGSNASDEMSDVYLQVIPYDSDETDVLIEHHAQYELRSKIKGYAKSLEVHPDDPWSREALAACLIADGRPREAIDLLDEKPALLESSVQARTVRAAALLANGEFARAIDSFRELLKSDDQVASNWLGLGQALARSEQPDEAEHSFRTALKIYPALSVARLDLIELLITRGDIAAAGEVIASVSKLENETYEWHFRLASLFGRHKLYDKSLRSFTEARKLAPFVYSPDTSLAIVCYQAGDELKARELFQVAHDKDPEDPVPHCFLGQIARRDGKFNLAAEHFLRAHEYPLPRKWPASKRREFFRLLYAEELQLAQETENLVLLRDTAEAWLQMEPDNVAVKKLFDDLNSQ